MNHEFVRHPTIKNYEALRDGVIRNCRVKEPVVGVNNSGYLRFKAGGKSYYNHSFVYEVFNGDFHKGLVIDHVDKNIKNNSVNNLRVLSQSKNCSLGNTGRCKTVTRRVIQSINAITAEEIIFQSIYAAGKYFGICTASVQNVAEKVTKSAFATRYNQNISFCYIPFVTDTIIGDNYFKDV